MYVVIVNFEVKSEYASDFLDAVLLQAANSLALEEQCRVFDVCTHPENSSSVLLYEHYDDAAAFDEHLKTSHFLDFDARVSPWLASKTVSTWQLEEAVS